MGRGARGAPRAEEGAHRGQRVIGEPPRPGQVPDRVGQLRVGGLGVGGGADLVGDLTEEQAVAPGERVQHGLVQRGQFQGVRRGQQQGGGVGQVEGDPAVLAGQGARTGPHHLPGGGEFVQQRGRVAGHAGRQDELLQGGRRYGGALQLLDRAHESVDAAQTVPAAHVLPLGEELGQGGGRHRLQFVPQRGERAAPQPAQHRRVAPLLADARRMELALHRPAARREPLQRTLGDGGAQSEAGGGRGRGERAVAAGVAGEEIAQGVLHRLGERLRHAHGQRGAERVAQPARVLHRRPVLGAADTHPDGPPGRGQLGRPPGGGAALGEFRVGERAQQPQYVGDALDVLDPAVLGEPLEFPLQLGEHLRVEQFAQLRLAEQLGQQPRVQRQRGGAALGERRVPLVQELRHVAEQQGAGEGGGLRGGHLHQTHLAGLDVAHEFGEPGDVEDVLEAFADGFQDDRERSELARHLEQLRRALTLLPQRGAPAGAAARQQQRAGGALAEAGGEQGRAADLVGDDLVHLALVEQDVRRADGGLLGVVGRARRGRFLVEQVEAHQVGVGKAQHDAVVGVHDLGVHAVPLGQPSAQRERPGGVDLRAERGVHHDPPVAQFVAEPLHDDRAVVRDVAAGLALLGEVGEHVVRRPGVQPRRQQPQPGVLLGQRAHLAQEGAQRAAQFQGTAQLVALPERQPARDAGSGGDQDPVARDVLDPPGTGAEREHVPDAGLVHHLLVELADPAAALLRIGAGQEDPEEPAVRDRAPGGDGQPLGTGAAGDRARHAVPHHARAQLRERVRRITAREHVQDRRERRLRQRGEGGRAADHGQQVVDLPGVQRHHGDELLREYVQRVGRDPQRLDGARAHPLGDHRGLHQIAPVLGEDHARGDRPHLVARAAHPL